jgi:AAA+ superfamily predicted ATPase
MDDLALWTENNERHLSAALEWLRLRLARLVRETPAPEPDSPAPRRSWFRSPPPEVKVSMPPSRGRQKHQDEEIRKAEDSMNAAAAQDPPPAVTLLQKRFGLSDFERSLLLLCAAAELDTRVPALCARAQDDPARNYPTFALAFSLFDDPPWEALSPDRPLRFWRLIDIHQPGMAALMSSALRVDERILNYIKGLNYLDERLEPLLEPVATDSEPLPASQQNVVESIVLRIKDTVDRRMPVFQLIGTDLTSKRLVAKAVCAALGWQLYLIPLALLPPQASETETLARLWQRECVLLPRALYIDAYEADTPASLLPLQRFLARGGGIFFCGLRDVRPDLARSSVSRDVNKPTPREQQEVWQSALGDRAGGNPGLLAGQFHLNSSEIELIAGTALDEPQSGAATLERTLWDDCLASTRPRLDALAQRIEPKASLNDVVLPAEEAQLLHQIADQVRQRSQVYDDWGFRSQMNRGLGISALFAGDSGTGKTMAAEALANYLRLNLYRIDLSAVVNKYIGETEKNLRRLFDAAEDGGAILFFDEADALFGKRSEVKDSHDRYANIEINYLLQRLESFGGLAILATNMKSALDPAFTRRLRFIVNFPFPGPKEREAIWRNVFPRRQPPLAEGLDFARLGKFNLTGANIQSIALNAAFLAARASETMVAMPRVLEAARMEFRKLDRTINEADFRVTEQAGAKA